jgi:hypothetical protein
MLLIMLDAWVLGQKATESCPRIHWPQKRIVVISRLPLLLVDEICRSVCSESSVLWRCFGLQHFTHLDLLPLATKLIVLTII